MSLGPSAFLASRMLGFKRRSRGIKTAGRRYLGGAIFGVALSIVPLVVVLVVSDGMITGITARYIETGTYHLEAEPKMVVERDSLEATAAHLRDVPGIRGAFLELQGYCVAISEGRTAGVALRAVEPSFLEEPGTATYLEPKSGARRLDSTNEILLGEALARNLGAAVGDTITIVTERSGYAGGKNALIPKLSAFRVRGIVSAGYRELDALWAFVSVKAGSKVFSTGSARALIGIKVAEPFGDLEPIRTKLMSSLPSGWRVVTWAEAETNVYKSFSTTRALLLLVMALAVAVAAINVSSALVMLFLERRRDIAILKSAGASPKFLGRAFALAGLGIGGTGTIFGIAIGSLLSWRINDLIGLIEWLVNSFARFWAALSGSALPSGGIRILDPKYYLESIPVSIHPLELALVACLSILLCLAASILPARRASRFSPMEILRKT